MFDKVGSVFFEDTAEVHQSAPWDPLTPDIKSDICSRLLDFIVCDANY